MVAIRDPRAIVVSLMHHSLSESDHFLHDRLQGMASDEERLAALISGVESTKGELRRGIAHQIDLILGWVEDPDVLTVRFEDLVGEAGGGDSAVQASAIKGLGDHIGIALTLEDAAAIGRDMFGKGKTFRKGSIDAWKEALGPELLTLLDGKIGDRLAKLGYHG